MDSDVERRITSLIVVYTKKKVDYHNICCSPNTNNLSKNGKYNMKRMTNLQKDETHDEIEQQKQTPSFYHSLLAKLGTSQRWLCMFYLHPSMV